MAKSTDGLNLFTKNYLVQNPKASILLIHGLGEHCERYAHVASALNKIGVNVYTFDLRGHGKSEGTAFFVRNIDEYREDVESIYRTIPKNLPFFILGHSMGGLIMLNFLLFNERNDVKGVVFSGAALEIGEDITPVTQTVVKFLAKIAPQLKTVKLDPNIISRNPKTVEAYKTDPLINHEGTKAGLGVAMLNKINELKPKFHIFNYPTLIMHGGADKLTNPAGSKALYEKCTSKDKNLKIWDGAYHEIFNEINQEEVINFMTNWVKNRI